MPFTSRCLRRCLVIAATAMLLFCAWYPPIQDRANAQVDAGLKRALISFASARTLNAIISVVQGTEVAVQPLGVGLTLTPGQVLDPINDLIEQFSSLMLVASVAFGIQKILLAVGGHWLVSTLVSGTAVLWALLICFEKSPAWLTRVVLLLLMIRFALPMVTLGSDLIFQQVMARQYQEQQTSLDLTALDVERRVPKTGQTQIAPGAANAAQGSPSSLWDRARGAVTYHIKEFPSLPSVNFEAIKTSVERLPERIVSLIGIFLAQTIIIPIVLLWALYRVAFGVVGVGLHARLRRPD